MKTNWSPAKKMSKAKRDCINFANGDGIALQRIYRAGQTIIMRALVRVTKCLLVRQPDAICRAIVPAIIFFEYAKCYWSAFFNLLCYVPRNCACTTAMHRKCMARGYD